eukprot:913874-Prymnesium_polylepis.1
MERWSCWRERAGVSAGRDGVSSGRDWHGALVVMTAGRADLIAGRDGLSAGRDGLIAGRDGLIAGRDGLSASRDGGGACPRVAAPEWVRAPPVAAGRQSAVAQWGEPAEDTRGGLVHVPAHVARVGARSVQAGTGVANRGGQQRWRQCDG